MILDQLLGADVQSLGEEDFVRRDFAMRELRVGNRARAERIAGGGADGDADVAIAIFMRKRRPDDPDFDAEWDRLARSEARSACVSALGRNRT